MSKEIIQEVIKILLSSFRSVGKISIFAAQVFSSMFSKDISLKALYKQLIDIGYYSLSVIGITVIFTGAALAMQSYSGFGKVHAEASLPIVVALSITRELAPVLCGLMIAGRVGSGIASEVAMMKNTEQIDALYTMSTDPVKYLVIPKVLAGTIITPIVVLIADFIGIMGGYIVAIYKLNMSSSLYLRRTANILQVSDISSGLLKASVFGFFICLIACFNGMNSKGGAIGVGNAATNTVMTSSVAVLLFNYIITGIMFST